MTGVLGGVTYGGATEATRPASLGAALMKGQGEGDAELMRSIGVAISVASKEMNRTKSVILHEKGDSVSTLDVGIPAKEDTLVGIRKSQGR